MTERQGEDHKPDRRPPAPADPAFERLIEYLRESRGFDFTGYKRASLMRRVRHQMGRLGVSNFEEYYDYLQVHPHEFTALFDTILINVSSFFRDRDTWSYLAEEALPPLLRDNGSAPIRVWSAGCAAGQEAYSLAMVLCEALGPDKFRERVKIYATDVDEDALLVARQAVYDDRQVSDLPDGFRERYFERSGRRNIFRQDLRRSVIFGRNDLVQDAPISRLDIIACRNTLMYLNAETQTRVISRFGFALRHNGLLFLGKAEMLVNHTSTFVPVDLRCRIFRKAPKQVADEAALPQTSPRRVDPADITQLLMSEGFSTSPVAQIVVDANGTLGLVNQRASALLNLGQRDIGRPFQDLEVSYRPAELRSQLAMVQETRAPAWLREVEWWRTPNEKVSFDIQLVPLTDSRFRLIGVSIIFNDVTRYRELQYEVETANRQLESAYEQLQSTNEELETTNEELQSTVEELETTNEELQSTNEELETTNEELQSTNDELQVTNDELRDRTTEISSLNRFMQSILSSLGAAVAVVNAAMIVQVWNKQAEDMWGLREDETVGEHLLNIDSGLPIEELKPLVRQVTADGEPRASTVVSAVNRRGRVIALRVTVTPLRSGTGAPDGALLLMESSGGGAAPA